MDNNTEDYFEYIDIITATIRRKRTGLFPRDAENIFIADNNIKIQTSTINGFLDKTQSDIPINPEKLHYFTKTSTQKISEHVISHQNILKTQKNCNYSLLTH